MEKLENYIIKNSTMSYKVIKHIEKILNLSGDKVNLIPTGNIVQSSIKTGYLSIEIEQTNILKENKIFKLGIPNPLSNDNLDEKFCINRIRLSLSIIDDYSKNHPYSDEEMKNLIAENDGLFGFY